MLKDIIKVHGRPKLVVTYAGQSFRNECIQQLRSMHIDNSYYEAYMPSRNGRAERSVGVVKKMLELNPLANDKNWKNLYNLAILVRVG